MGNTFGRLGCAGTLCSVVDRFSAVSDKSSLKVAELRTIPAMVQAQNFAESSLVLTGAPQFRKFTCKGSVKVPLP
jgi:hypothetical protein